MARLPGDPGLGRQALFALGAKLPERNREWVRHELTDAGWRGRLVTRHLIVTLVAEDGQRVSAGDTVVVLEAMKMEQPLTAHKDGTVTGLSLEVGQTVSAGAAICELTD